MQEHPSRIDPHELRRLSRVSDTAAALDIGATWLSILCAAGLAVVVDHWTAVLAAMVFIGSRQNALAVLAHEGWHCLLFSSRETNHRLGSWLCAYPIGIPFHHVRARHLRHHREVGVPHDPDWKNYTHEGRETPLRAYTYLLSLLAGRLFWETAFSLVQRGRPRTDLGGAGHPPVAAEYMRAITAQLVLFAAFTAVFSWWAYPVLWFGSLASFAGFFANTRALIEHLAPAGCAPDDRIRDFDASWLERALLSPFHFHYHGLHHAQPSIPHRNLPAARRWFSDHGVEYPAERWPGYLRSLQRELDAARETLPTQVFDEPGLESDRNALANKPEYDTRQPQERVIARCDFCGGASGTPVTGALRDVESADQLPVAFRELEFRFIRCDDCELVYMRERPCPDDLDVFYGEAYKCYESYEERGRIMAFLARTVAKHKLNEIRRRMPEGSGTLLDYGCGSGTWLELMRELDCEFDLIGTDVTSDPIRRLEQKGIRAYCCDERTLFDHVEPESVGVIHLFHVIEHLPEPRAVLEQLHRALVPGGVVVGQTPNIASVGCRVFGDHWNQWHVPRHLVLFDHETLRRHAEAAGFEVEPVRSSLSGATQWALSALSWWAERRGRAFRSTHEPLYPPLILGCIPIALVEGWLAHTCHMDFVLRKPGRGA